MGIEKKVGYVSLNIAGQGPEVLQVEGTTVYRNVLGGDKQTVGFVKDGVAYQNVCGADPEPIGDVSYETTSKP